MDDTAALLREVAELGEFFALPVADDGGWLPISTLLTDTAMRDYTRRTQAAIASSMGVAESAVPLKAAASSLHLSIAARLLSPVVGAAVCLAAVPRLTTETVKWQRDSSHRPALAMTRADWVRVTDPHQAARAIAETVITDVFAPLNDTMRSAAALSPQVLWGNVASAANGAVTVLAQTQAAAERRGRALVAALIATAPLLDAAEFAAGQFRRRNCCLFYQVPGGGYCGDCVLAEAR
ncbi:hypothetical protein AFM11_00970 [Mycolicibacterium wolinskyi]|uniref:Ferric siderophore reductase C-terminal domain-containing protein n=1 Tax=Mycolicibacterium wolinskyi TaxID=59750 RepID=A0A132PUE4_9MYCO|nr:(2Fe-2S)-binding protein [Mycolicibacterium wolinskyi]KWX25894.1 hypothetical protein AFM11_00970 [Mycolicibacterium wolinskyi]